MTKSIIQDHITLEPAKGGGLTVSLRLIEKALSGATVTEVSIVTHIDKSDSLQTVIARTLDKATRLLSQSLHGRSDGTPSEQGGAGESEGGSDPRTAGPATSD